MKHPDHIRFEIEGVIYESWPQIEQSVKNAMFYNHYADSIVICRDFDTDEVLDELRLDELFNQ